jgi:hypothetical protein
MSKLFLKKLTPWLAGLVLGASVATSYYTTTVDWVLALCAFTLLFGLFRAAVYTNRLGEKV